ncbi:MAG TPA: Slp family lipoprotein [Rhodanobacteraceae bacterium]|nr:Slp family lipoprotein [Rhodanobacteraceae bacterium]
MRPPKRIASLRAFCGIAFVALAALLAACAPPPIYKPDPSVIAANPAQVAAAPERYGNAQVIWGGRVVTVRNFPDHSEVEMLDYPLDSSQRPRVNETAAGRFIALMPGYVESMDYPEGTLMTLRGTLAGTRAGKVGNADYVFPLVQVAQSHRWTPREMEQGKSHFSFGVGVGVVGGIH